MIAKHVDFYVLFATKAQRTEGIHYVNMRYERYNISGISE